MKPNFSLSLKLTLLVVSISAVVIFSLTYVNILQQNELFEDAYFEKAASFSKALDASIPSYDQFNDKQKLQNYISNFSKLNPDILKLSINLPDEEGLHIFVSTDGNLVGSPSGMYNNLSYNKDAIIYIPTHSEDTHKLTMLAPINLSGQIAGTYEIVLSMDAAYTALDIQMRNLVLISAISLFILIFSFLYMLRRAIVKPITTFRDATEVIGEGNLNEEINIKSRDELGDLATAFNKMTTDLKISRNKIEKYNKTLEKLLSQKDEFIGQLGHDLKNPLTPLVGLLPMITEQEKDPKLKEHLRLLTSNAEYMRELIFKTLQLARLRSSNVKFDIQHINLNEEIDNVLDRQQSFLKENNINIENEVNDKISIKADKLRLGELFNNLITNAVKYTPKDGGVITIEAKKDRDFVTISVKDSGIGMTKEQLGRIFDEFYRADKSMNIMDSTGLGLSICKRIVEKHGGRIWAESPGKGKGTTFYFTLKPGNGKIIKNK
ncbi:MAG: HAMP domain-containing histidine kinase [Thermoplasmatales archaeon]|nr:MAG: HAMP domain-containing histidine kinase [Thermoplasmatales archaeon]